MASLEEIQEEVRLLEVIGKGLADTMRKTRKIKEADTATILQMFSDDFPGTTFLGATENLKSYAVARYEKALNSCIDHKFHVAASLAKKRLLYNDDAYWNTVPAWINYATKR